MVFRMKWMLQFSGYFRNTGLMEEKLAAEVRSAAFETTVAHA
ncbi:hypothetical protein COLO4_15507 [Corchorus olitorius]|uniref:Uncharacterized protein n=1 Tax=Corchorus olitorius TaxID=93759 RepID=A0A1R3JMQ9_9ROSI|nr:hypothetical protein COLO4_15507 [Corchorus olitorius]